MDESIQKPKRKYTKSGKPRKPLVRTDDNEYEVFSTDLGGIVCVKCHIALKQGDFLFGLNFGRELPNQPVAKYLRFTGIYWHRDCLDLPSLPGLEGREGMVEEFQDSQIRFSKLLKDDSEVIAITDVSETRQHPEEIL